jgi:hypothetical protein
MGWVWSVSTSSSPFSSQAAFKQKNLHSGLTILSGKWVVTLDRSGKIPVRRTDHDINILRRTSRQPVRSGQRGRLLLVVPPDVRLTQTIKHRDEHGKLLSVEIHAALGEVVSEPCTVHIERVNGTLRDRLNALTRKTHAFAKRDATFDALVHLQLFEHNWIRPHRALRLPLLTEPRRYQPRTPAMALGLTQHPWSWISFLTTSLYTTPK